MAKIYCKNREYTGVSATVTFTNGEGETESKELIEWFKLHGYEVDDKKDTKPKVK